MHIPVQRLLRHMYLYLALKSRKSLRHVSGNVLECTYMNVFVVFTIPCSAVTLTPEEKKKGGGNDIAQTDE
jgi:hypothetical protein